MDNPLHVQHYVSLATTCVADDEIDSQGLICPWNDMKRKVGHNKADDILLIGILYVDFNVVHP
jgi:hypothetical protein